MSVSHIVWVDLTKQFQLKVCYLFFSTANNCITQYSSVDSLLSYHGDRSFDMQTH